MEELKARPPHASATIESAFEFVVAGQQSAVRVSTAAQVDRASMIASSVTNVSLTLKDPVDGIDVPLNVGYQPLPPETQIDTADATFIGGATAADPWTRTPVGPYYYRSWLSEYLIPTYDDVVGFELASMPSVDALGAEKAGDQPVGARSKDFPSDVVRALTYATDADTFARVAPILHRLSELVAAPTNELTFTIGFDEDGLLRYFDLVVEPRAAVKMSQRYSDPALLFVAWRVTDVSDNPIVIDVPTNFIDPPADPPAEAPPA